MVIYKGGEFLDLMRAGYEEGGYVAALYDAVLYLKDPSTFPDWVLRGLVVELERRIKIPIKTSSGPKGNEALKLKVNQRHYRRYWEVRSAKSKGAKGDKILEVAKKRLHEINDLVELDAIEASFKRVRKALKNPKSAAEFYKPFHQTMEHIGIKPHDFNMYLQ